ncbi:MAG TPA: RIP metalloprotease RseP [Magnetospirillaceae bacterium]|nr:RIP metalloprotease RseP [Magnetospirillaceae bacterium]
MIAFLMNVWDYVIVFLAILTVVVFVHELGHYLVARWCGVKIETFSIGFGPELFGWYDKAGTRWRISALPLGGYVKMFGDADPASTPDSNREFTAAEKAVAFQYKTVWQRIAVVFAGPAMNFIFGIVALAILLAVYGEPRNAPVIDQVQENSAAAEVGLQKGDRVVEAAGQQVKSWQDLQKIIQMSVGEPIPLVVTRDDQRVELLAHPQIKEVTDLFGNVHKTPLLGILPDTAATELVRFNPATALWESVTQTWDMVGSTLKGIGQMILGERDSSEVGGPLRIAKGAGAAAKIGLGGVAYYIILLSINLGLFNLFPVPLLDGGHLLFYGIEALRGRPLGQRAQEYGFRLGLFLVFALMLFTTRNDLLDLRVWDFIKRVIS